MKRKREENGPSTAECFCRVSHPEPTGVPARASLQEHGPSPLSTLSGDQSLGPGGTWGPLQGVGLELGSAACKAGAFPAVPALPRGTTTLMLHPGPSSLHGSPGLPRPSMTLTSDLAHPRLTSAPGPPGPWLANGRIRPTIAESSGLKSLIFHFKRILL